MMLHCHCSKDLGHNGFNNPSKLHNLLSPLKPPTWVFLGFNGHDSHTSPKPLHFTDSRRRNHGQSSSGSRVLVGFKLQCVTNTPGSPSKALVPINGKKRRHGGILPSVLRSLESERDVEKALSFYVGKLSPKEQTLILKEQGSWERVVRVFNWIRSQKDYVPDVIHYTVVLQTLCRAQRWDESRLCWIEMAKDGVLPDNHTYSMLISEYGKAGLVSGSLLWIKHMRVRGIFPNEVTMSAIVKVLKDAGEFDRADRFYKDWCVGKVDFQTLGLNDMNEFGAESHSKPISFKHSLSMELFKIGARNSTSDAAVLPEMENAVRKPQLTTPYNSLIDLYGKAGRLNDAAEVFTEMLKAGVAPNTITFNTMIHICGSHGNLTEAEALLNKMEERGVSPSTETYNTLLSLYAEAGNVDAALQWYWKIRNAGLFPNVVTCRIVLSMLCKKQLIQEVETVLSEMEKCNVNVHKYCVPRIVKMYVSKGLLDQARIFFEKCQVHGGLSSKTYAAIMDVYAQKGLCAEAEAVFHAKRDQGGRKRDVMEYNAMIKAFCKGKRYKRAFSIFKGMRNSGTWPNECTYNSLIQMFAGGNLVDWAKKVLNQMQEVGLKPRYLSYSAMIASYARQGLLSDAIRTFEQMERAGLKANEVVYGALIKGFAEAGRTEEALHYYRRMEERGVSPDTKTYNTLLSLYAEAGNVDAALQWYWKIRNAGLFPDVVTHRAVLNMLCEKQLIQEVETVLSEMEKCNLNVHEHSVPEIIKMYASKGLLDQARIFFEKCQVHGGLSSKTYAAIMDLYAEKGLCAEAEAVFHAKRDQGAMIPRLSILPRRIRVGHNTPRMGHGIRVRPLSKL